jgi:hypothetical protein
MAGFVRRLYDVAAALAAVAPVDAGCRGEAAGDPAQERKPDLNELIRPAFCGG